MSLSSPLEALPVELQLMVIGMLSLTSLIKMRGVSQKWKTLIQANLDKPHVIHPTRRALLFVWETFISRPCFLKSRKYTLPLIKPFDREAYISKLPTGAPLGFEMWIREWPSSAVIGWIWPGLDGKSFDLGPWCWWRTRHTNQLSVENGGPSVSRLTLKKSSYFGRDSVDAIHILKRLHFGRDVRLAVDHENKEFCWSVIASCKGARDVGEGPFKRSETYPTWTAYLYSYIDEIDDQCRAYYTHRPTYADVRINGHQWTLVRELDEAEADDPVYEADEGPKNLSRGDWCLVTNDPDGKEEVMFFHCPKAPGDMGGTDTDSDDSYDWDDTDGSEAEDADGADDGADSEDD